MNDVRRQRGRLSCQAWDEERAHQRMAGLASWAAWSARWRARQGLPLLHPLDVQYLSPQDFWTLSSPVAQRRRFREYVVAAIAEAARMQQTWNATRRMGVLSGELAFVRLMGMVRWDGNWTPDYLYGRDDLAPYDPEALAPARPYGVPTVSPSFRPYWLDGTALESAEDDLGDDRWIASWNT